VGDVIYLAYCEENSGAQGILALQRRDGRELWRKVVHPSGSMSKNAKSSGASGSVACDGQRLFVNFANEGRVVLTALDLQGEILWQQEVAPYQVHQGFGASPAIHEHLVYSVADTKGGGAIIAVDRENGRIAWRRDRPSNPNYPSPIVLQVAGRQQLILTGLDQVESLHPSTGETLWKIEGSTTECVTTTVTDGQRVYSSGGYPRNHLAAIEADGSGKITWETNDRVYVPSLLIRDGYLYGTLDAGIAACWEAATGKEMWKERLGGDISSSPVLVGDRIYATNEAAETFVFRANQERFELLGKNSLGDEQFATPTFCRGQILMRVAYREGQERREQLVCIEE
jgi:outer membrane protein assembly factor BamB